MQGRIGSRRDAGPAGPLDFKGAPGGREQRQPPRRRPSRPLDADRPGHQRSEEDHQPSASRSVHIVGPQQDGPDPLQQPADSTPRDDSIHRGQPLARPVGHGPAGSIGMATVNYSTNGQTSQGERRSAEARNQTTTVGYQKIAYGQDSLRAR